MKLENSSTLDHLKDIRQCLPCTIVPIDKSNLIIFQNLAQAYEAEFSRITKKKPNHLGIFKLDTEPTAPYAGYLFYHDGAPIGFSIFEISQDINDIAEFYIIPAVRKKGLGHYFATYLFNKYPGTWHVRQIDGASDATQFWRTVISKYTNNHFEESKISDKDWGEVTRQRFRA